MIIHSITPPEYLMPQSQTPPTDYMPCKYGFVAGTHTPQGFMVSRLITTDLSAYLDKGYDLGTILPHK